MRGDPPTTPLQPVAIGEGRVGVGDGTVFAVHGLGSCVALCLYDPGSRCGGLCHVVLHSSALGQPTDPPAKFADTAARWLLGEMVARGAERSRTVARIVGGANLFLPGPGGLLAVGERNVIAVRAALAREAVPLVGEEVGGRTGRTVVFRLGDGRVEVYVGGTMVRVL